MLCACVAEIRCCFHAPHGSVLYLDHRYNCLKDMPKMPTGRKYRKTSGSVRVIASRGRRTSRPHLPPERYCVISSAMPPQQKPKEIIVPCSQARRKWFHPSPAKKPRMIPSAPKIAPITSARARQRSTNSGAPRSCGSVFACCAIVIPYCFGPDVAGVPFALLFALPSFLLVRLTVFAFHAGAPATTPCVGRDCTFVFCAMGHGPAKLAGSPSRSAMSFRSCTCVPC